MRPVDKGTDPPYTTDTDFTFSGANAEALRTCLNQTGRVFSITDCLELWLGKVKNASSPCSKGQRNTSVSAIQNQVDKLYKTASAPLTKRLGPFCSYCESPISGLLEVEHCVPKSNYPTFSTSWANFLLSCGPCNTSKSNNPDRNTATGWTGKTDPTEQELYDQIRKQHYVWPDLNPDAYEWMPHVLQYYGSGAWRDADMTTAANTKNVVLSTDISSREVTATLHKDSTSQDVSVRVVVKSNTSNEPTDYAQETIDLCKLNGVSKSTSTYDRRVMNRTLAWFTCLKSLDCCMEANKAIAPAVWEMLLMLAAHSGFYSVWLTLIKHVLPKKAHKFVTDTNKQLYFPGTDTVYLP